ncbi:MAG: hypothetical protein WB810_15515, partial [Candidatus Cybelea sp.]
GVSPLQQPGASPTAEPPLRIYVTAIPCSFDSKGQRVEIMGPPNVTLSDQASLVEFDHKGITPSVTVTQSESNRISFYFDAEPGFYEVFLRFPNSSTPIGNNGPLIVIPRRDRHLVVASCNSVTDWHARGVIAGLLPITNLTVSALVFEHSMQCGDDYRALNQGTLQPLFKFTTRSVVTDDGAYYATFYGVGKQDRTIALLFSGALYNEGAILVTNAARTPDHKLPFIRKDITQDVIEAALRANRKLACVDGF